MTGIGTHSTPLQNIIHRKGTDSTSITVHDINCLGIIHHHHNNTKSFIKQEQRIDLLKKAISSGFKNSGLKSIGSKIIVEICSTERLDSPIGNNGQLFSSENHLKFLVDISNHILKKSRRKLNILEKNIINKL